MLLYSSQLPLDRLTHPLSQIRNLSRLIWINVALPPTESSTPENLKGKVQFTPATTADQLRKQKQDVIKLCLGYAFAVKHYLRGEDGLDWDDYLDVFPTSLLKLGPNDGTTSENPSLGSSMVAPSSKDSSAAVSRVDNGKGTPDATKRIRVKRSRQNLSRKTNLLEGSHWHAGYSAIDIHTDITMPLPLMCAFFHRLSYKSVDPKANSIAHEISHTLFAFKREGLLETVGPAGSNAMQQSFVHFNNGRSLSDGFCLGSREWLTS